MWGNMTYFVLGSALILLIQVIMILEYVLKEVVIIVVAVIAVIEGFPFF